MMSQVEAVWYQLHQGSERTTQPGSAQEHIAGDLAAPVRPQDLTPDPCPDKQTFMEWSTARRLRFLCLAVAAGWGLSACQSSAEERPTRPAREATPDQDPYLIEGEELRATKAINLYEAVRVRRPTWIDRRVNNQSGDRAVAVYLDDRRIGSMNILREMPIYVALGLQYLSPSQAQIRFGPQHGTRAAIVVMYAKDEPPY
jgi:hypothetical protein